MEREIKFRALELGSNQWVYGHYCKDYAGVSYITTMDGVSTSTVDEETIGQFTDIKDKNGKDVYEGDILKCYDNSAEDKTWGLDKIHIGVIEYTPNCFSLKIPGKLIYDSPAVKQWDKDVFLNYWCNAENIEVIGNIYQNPELLTK